MPVSAHIRPVSISLLSVPEVSAAVVYGLQEVFTCVGTSWETLTGERTNTRLMAPKIVGQTKEPMRTTMNAFIVPNCTFVEARRSDVVIVSDLNFVDDKGASWSLEKRGRMDKKGSMKMVLSSPRFARDQ